MYRSSKIEKIIKIEIENGKGKLSWDLVIFLTERWYKIQRIGCDYVISNEWSIAAVLICKLL